MRHAEAERVGSAALRTTIIAALRALDLAAGLLALREPDARSIRRELAASCPCDALPAISVKSMRRRTTETLLISTVTLSPSSIVLPVRSAGQPHVDLVVS